MMGKKKVTITPKDQLQAAKEAFIKTGKAPEQESFLEPPPAQPGTASEAPSKITKKRLTIDVSPALHRRMKTACASRGLQMADIVRELLEKEFPEE